MSFKIHCTCVRFGGKQAQIFCGMGKKTGDSLIKAEQTARLNFIV